jgi:hypothetical protein
MGKGKKVSETKKYGGFFSIKGIYATNHRY